MQQINRKKVLSGLFWRFAERCGSQGVSLIVSIVLARLLSPEDYGTIALVTVFTTILQVFVDSGLGTSLVQKKDVDELDYSSVFYFNLILCVTLYAGMFLLAPCIAEFYGKPELILVVRVLSITVIIFGLQNIQQSYVSRNLLFRRFFFATLIGTITSAVVGIGMAYAGYGIWALVGQQISNSAVNVTVLWVTVRWRPRKGFSLKRLKGLLKFGWKILASTLLDTIYNNVRSLIIGKIYSSADLAYYNQGKKFPYVIVTNINSSIDSVLLPVMSNSQDNRAKVKAMTRRAIKTSSYIMWPLMVGLAVCARPMVILLLTEKWLPCVPFLQIFCFSYAFYPMHTANLNAIKALGRSDVFLKLEIIKKIVGVASILITVPFGVLAIAMGMFVTTPISVLINSFPNKKLLGYSFKEQFRDLIPYIGLSLFMGVCVYPLQFLNASVLMVLILQIIIGMAIYLLGSYLLHLDVFEDILKMLKAFRSANC